MATTTHRAHSAQNTSAKANSLLNYLIDHPGKDRSDLVPPFIPTTAKIPLEQRKVVLELPPFDTLPRILIPTSKSRLKPPVMHCGWVANESLLLEYAREHKIPILRRAKLKDTLDIDGEDEFDEEMNTVVPIDSVDPREDRMAYVFLLNDALSRIVQELNIPWPLRLLSLTRPMAAGCPLIISLFTNYHLAKAPRSTAIEALRMKLHETEQPKWFLDSSDWRWSYYGPRW
ncbi:hypothetical protein BKA93DRAFT_930569 [Sparassis latifolia]